MVLTKRKVKHPAFEFAARGYVGNERGIAFVFNRTMWKPVPRKLARDYRRREKIVDALGGRMCRPLYEEAGKNPPFSPKEVAAMIRKVVESHRDLTFDRAWNGAGYYSLSVGMVKKPKKRRKS